MTDREYIESADVPEWLSEGRAREGGTAAARAFAGYLDSLPWAGTVLDWPRIPHRKLNLAERDAEEGAAELASSWIGTFSECLFLFSPDAPALVFATEDVVENFDEITGSRSGHGYFCGVRDSGTGLVPACAAFLCYDGADHVRMAVQVRRRVHASRRENQENAATRAAATHVSTVSTAGTRSR